MFDGILRLKDARAEIERLSTELDDWREVNAAAIEKIKAAELKIDEKDELLDARNAELVEAHDRIVELESRFITAEEKAAAIVAQMGVIEPAEIDELDVPRTSEELWSEYHALKSNADKQAFYQTHREILKGNLNNG